MSANPGRLRWSRPFPCSPPLGLPSQPTTPASPAGRVPPLLDQHLSPLHPITRVACLVPVMLDAGAFVHLKVPHSLVDFSSHGSPSSGAPCMHMHAGFRRFERGPSSGKSGPQLGADRAAGFHQGLPRLSLKNMLRYVCLGRSLHAHYFLMRMRYRSPTHLRRSANDESNRGRKSISAASTPPAPQSLPPLAWARARLPTRAAPKR